MTDRTSGQHRTTAGLGDSLRWTNTSGETIPAYGVIQLRSDFADGYNQASKPDGASGLFFANGAVAVLATKKGESLLWNRPRLVKVDGSPSVGDEVGPVADSWAMSEGGTGFFVMHQPVDGVAAVVQVGSGGGGSSRWGIVVERLGCGWYTIELGTLDGSTEASGSGPVCDPCIGVTGAGTSSCELVLEYPTPRVVGLGTYVTALDPASVLVPLKVGTDCVVTKMQGVTAPASGSGSGSGGPASGSGSGVVSQAWSVRGLQEHIVEYKERGQCCDDGVYRVVGKTPIIFAAKVCDEILCEECPASGSGS